MARMYYHVAGEQYQSGDPLLCYDRLTALGIEIEWKWGDLDVGYDGDVVCLFETLAEAHEYQSEYGGTLLTVTIPDELDGIYELPWSGCLNPWLTTVDEGYPAVHDGIPAEWINREANA